MPYEKEIQILSELRSEYSCFDPNEREYYHALSEAISSLKNNRHGHWSLNPHNRAWDVCSACGIGTKRREYGINPDGTEYVTEYSYRYCPNCGAKMDEVEE